MRKTVLTLLLVSSFAHAQLKLEPVNVLLDFSGWLQNVCLYADNLENLPLGPDIHGAITWMCATLPAIDRAANLAQSFLAM